MAVIIYGIVNPASRANARRDDGHITVEIRRCAVATLSHLRLVNSFGFSSRALSFSVLSPSYPVSRANTGRDDGHITVEIRRCAVATLSHLRLVNSFGFSSRALSFSVLSPSYPVSRANTGRNACLISGASLCRASLFIGSRTSLYAPLKKARAPRPACF